MNGLGLENEFPRKILFYAPSIYRIVPLSEEIKASAGDGKGFVDITTVAFDRASGIRMATGDVAGSIRIYTLNNAPEVTIRVGRAIGGKLAPVDELEIDQRLLSAGSEKSWS